jgi:hypothetical protein
MSDVQITKTFNGWLLEDKDDNLWSYSDSEVDGFIDQLSQLIDLQMVLSSDSPFYGGEMPLQASPEQPPYKHPESEIFNLSEDTTCETDPSLVDPEKVYRGDGPTTDPITPMADLNPLQQDNYFDGLPNGQAQE